MVRHLRSFLLVGLGAGVLASAACSTEKTGSKPSSEDAGLGSGGYGGYAGFTPACEALIEACHDVDPGLPGDINTCHQIGHDNIDSECVAERERCVDLCMAAWPDAGADGGDAGPRDGGHGGAPLTDAELSGRAKCDYLASFCHGLAQSGPLADCHNIGHDRDVPVCEENFEHCETICREARGE